MEPDRSGALHPARCVCQRPDAVADARSAGSQQLSGQHDGADVEPVLVPLQRHVARAVRDHRGGQLLGRVGRLEQLDRQATAGQQPASSRRSDRRRSRRRRDRASRTRSRRASASSTRRAAKARCCSPATHTVGLKLSKRFRLGGTRDFELATNILNLLNAGRGTEYARGGRQPPIQHRGLPPAGQPAGRAVVSAGHPVPLLIARRLVPRRS